jgi:hypothetical protein
MRCNLIITGIGRTVGGQASVFRTKSFLGEDCQKIEQGVRWAELVYKREKSVFIENNPNYEVVHGCLLFDGKPYWGVESPRHGSEREVFYIEDPSFQFQKAA